MWMLSACQPALNWREVRPQGAGAALLFPCKPEVEQRPARGGEGAMGLATCESGSMRVSLSWADLPDPTRAAAALRAMPQALAGKIGQPLPPPAPLVVDGMTPMAEAAQYRIGGTRAAVFAYGGRVYQAVMTPATDSAAWETFIGGVRVGAAAGSGR